MERFRSLPLFWRLLLPFFVLLLALAVVGAGVVVRSARVSAEADLDAEVSDAFLTTRSRVQERELSALESANFAANINGMAVAVADSDTDRIDSFLQSVLALKTELELVVIANRDGSELAGYLRPQGGSPTETAPSPDPRSQPRFVREALSSAEGARSSGLLHRDGQWHLAVAAPICSANDGCAPVGVAIAGVRLETIVAELLEPNAGIAIYDLVGESLSNAGLIPPNAPPPQGAELERRSVSVAGTGLVMALGTLEAGGRTLATLAVSSEDGPRLAAVRSTSIRLGVVLTLAMVAVVAIGSALARSIVGQLRPLMETNRRLGAGDLTARAPVGEGGEITELADGINAMAEQLQASVDRLEARVEERTTEIQRLLDERSEFFAGLSHELRTPLAAVVAQAELLRSGHADNEEVAEILTALGGQLIGTVDSILQLARIEAGTADMEAVEEQVEVESLFAQVRSGLSHLAVNSGLELSVEPAHTVPAVSADRRMAQAVLTALVENAVKYTPAGGVVEVRAEAANGHVDLLVQDTGVGIPEDVGDHIFEPFARVAGTNTQAGQPSSGLGLAVAKRFAEAQGGSLNYVSDGTGTTFSFRLEAVSS